MPGYIATGLLFDEVKLWWKVLNLHYFFLGVRVRWGSYKINDSSPLFSVVNICRFCLLHTFFRVIQAETINQSERGTFIYSINFF